MQWARPMPTRRLIILCLVLYVTGLAGCGGGGGSSAPVPPVTNPIGGGGSVLDQGKAASLFNTIDGKGEAWLGLVDSDSGFFHLTGEDPETNEILEKIPDLDPDRSITRQFSRLDFIPPPLVNSSDPGRYMVLGRLAPTLPDATVEYDLSGHWTCAGCLDSLSLLDGTLSGQLVVDGSAETAELHLGDGRIDLNAHLTINKNAEISDAGLPQLRFDDQELTIIRSKILGGLFGPEAEEAGVLFGIADDQGWVFSGGASGIQQP